MASCSRIVRDETYRVGLEVYYTGRQELEHNPSPYERWTTDVCTELSGLTANAGVRFTFGSRRTRLRPSQSSRNVDHLTVRQDTIGHPARARAPRYRSPCAINVSRSLCSAATVATQLRLEK